MYKWRVENGEFSEKEKRISNREKRINIKRTLNREKRKDNREQMRNFEKIIEIYLPVRLFQTSKIHNSPLFTLRSPL